VVRRGTTCLCGSDRRAPDRRAGPRRAVRRLVTILRREAAAGVSAALLHLGDACCPADVAVPPVLPAGKEPRNFGLHRVKPRGRPPAHRHHPAAAECCAQADHPPDQGVNAPYRSPQSGRPQTATLVDAGTRSRTAVILSPFGISPGHEGFLRLRHVAYVRLCARPRSQKRGDKEIDAGHVRDIASGCVVYTT
jgi:hypothetical protein